MTNRDAATASCVNNLHMDDNTKDLVSVLDPLLCTLARIFAAEGKAREVAVLANAKASIQQSGYDSWDGGTYLYTVSLEIPTQLDAQIAAHRDEIQQTILLRAQGTGQELPERGYRGRGDHCQARGNSGLAEPSQGLAHGKKRHQPRARSLRQCGISGV